MVYARGEQVEMLPHVAGKTAVFGTGEALPTRPSPARPGRDASWTTNSFEGRFLARPHCRRRAAHLLPRGHRRPALRERIVRRPPRIGVSRSLIQRNTVVGRGAFGHSTRLEKLTRITICDQGSTRHART